MNKSIQSHIEHLVFDVLKSYYCSSDVEYLISLLSDDVIWLGASDNQKAQGRDQVAAFFRAGQKDLMPCRLFDESFITDEIVENVYVCQNDCYVEVLSENQSFFKRRQRITFILKGAMESYQISYIHHSIAYDEVREGELFPAQSIQKENESLQEVLVKTNAEMWRQTKFLEQLFNSIPCGILQFTTDSSHSTLSENPMVWQFYGYESEEEYHKEIKSPIQLISDKDRDEVVGLINSLTLGGGTINYTRETIKKNGEMAWVSVIMERLINANGMEVIQAIFTDMTEIRRLQKIQGQQQLMENQFLRAAVCTAYPLIISINLNKDTYNSFIEDENYYLADREGSFDGLKNTYLSFVYPSYRQEYTNFMNRERLLSCFKKGEREAYLELKQKGIDNAYHWISIHIIHVENPLNDDVLAIQLVKVLDSQRAEKAKQEQVLRDALATAITASRSKSDFLSRMSHDIRTPMNAIIGMSTIGQLEIEDKEKVRDCFYKIDLSCKYLLSLINDILDMSKIESGKMNIERKKFNLNDFVEQISSIVRPQALSAGITFEVNKNKTMDENYIGDVLRSNQIIMNLLSNSLKFTPEGGSITLQIYEKYRNSGYSYIKFIVTDTGIGISENFIEKLFQPFEQESSEEARNNVGSGLGLSIVYNLVQLMNGTIRVESGKDKGTSFFVTIPYKLDRTNTEAILQIKEDNTHSREKNEYFSKLKGKHLLLVDDNDLNLEIGQELLQINGFKVDTAENGKAALEEFMKKPDFYYYAILMDIRMPEMNGLEATAAIRNLKKKDAGLIPILAMTANAFEEDKVLAYEAGMTGYLIKPLDVDILMEELYKL